MTTKPKHSSPDSRTQTIATKVTPAMLEDLIHEARSRGITLSALLHTILMNIQPATHQPPVTMEDL